MLVVFNLAAMSCKWRNKTVLTVLLEQPAPVNLITATLMGATLITMTTEMAQESQLQQHDNNNDGNRNRLKDFGRCPSIFYCTLLYSILHYILLYTILYSILYYTLLYIILYSILFYCTILYYTILYYTILYYTILYYTILYDTIRCYLILYDTIEHYASLYGQERCWQRSVCWS